MGSFTHPGGNPLEFAACGYAIQDGWPVFPVNMAAKAGPDKVIKKPHINAWPDKASTKQKQISAWWKKWPQAGVGVVTGQRSGLVVVDVDGPTGRASLASLTGQHGALPATLKTVTGREDGGAHYFFTSDADIRNSAGKVGADIDVRGNGGYVVVAPTVNPVTGKTYAWADVSADPATLPDWLIAATHKPADAPEPPTERRISTDAKSYALAALEDELQEMRLAPKHTRNDLLNIKAGNLGQFIGGGYLEEDDVRVQLTQAALTAGLPIDRIKDTITSGFKYGKARPLTLISDAAADQAEAYADRLASRAMQERINREARRLVDAEEVSAVQISLPRITLKEALAEERPPEPPMRLDGLHRVGYNSTITAEFGTGKTTLGGNLLRSLADGVPFLGKYAVLRPAGRIGLLNYELTDTDMLDWLEDQGIDNPDRIALLNLRGQPFSLASPGGQDKLVEWCRDMDVEVLHLDPHRRAFAGFGKENDNDDVNRYTGVLDEIKKAAGVPDLFLYVHTGRQSGDEGSEHARGATALDDWADQRWVLTKKEQERFLYVEKRLPYVPEFRLTYDSDTRHLVAEHGNRRSRADDRYRDRILQVLKDVGATGAITGELETRLSVRRKGELKNPLQNMLGQAYVVMRSKAGAHRYWLPEHAPKDTS